MKAKSFSALASFAIQPCCATGLAEESRPQLVSRQDAAPPADRFVRRADVAVTVLDDYLYIVGGGVSVHLAGDKDNAEARVAGLNVTLALSLKNDWKSRDAQYDIIENSDEFGETIGHALWANEKDNEIVTWGGRDFSNEVTGSRDPRVLTLAVDGNGGGKWTSREPPSDLRRAAFGGYAQCGGKGFFVGGFGGSYTNGPAFDGPRIAVPGLIVYDFATSTFKNETTKGLTDSGAFQKGSAVCVELPGRDPKLFVIGGGEPKLTDVSDSDVSLQSFDNAYIYDLGLERWLKQETQGSRPEARQGTCVVGANGPNGTYEIFMYGGFRDGGGPMDDAWVFSIPAFRWFRVEAKSDTRYSHACARVGSQMIVVGGNDNPVWNKKDPFPKGLGVFSLNTLEWKDAFEADAAEYQGPSVVRDWYDTRGQDTIPWGSDEIKKAFLSSKNEDGGDVRSPSDPRPTPEPESSGSTPAIVGGVIGGVLALAVGVGIFWWCRRKRNKVETHERIAEADESFAMKPYEMDSGHVPSELSSPATERVAESRSGTKRYEMDAQYHAVELPA